MFCLCSWSAATMTQWAEQSLLFNDKNLAKVAALLVTNLYPINEKFPVLVYQAGEVRDLISLWSYVKNYLPKSDMRDSS